ncbi:MAG: HAD-IIB family hydrolase [Muribaculaceae bacterium]|nr:HAD-IIB family hydrolase [Muribaculaceae bacterium]
MARKDTLYVTDMDGTLLGSDSRVSERSREIIGELSHEGYNITVATARTPATVVPLLEGVYTRIPAIVITGAALWSRGRHEGYERVHTFEDSLYDGLTRLFEERGISPFVYTLPEGSEVLEVYRNPRHAICHAEELFVDERRHLRLKRFHLDREAPEEARERTLLFFGMGPLDRILEVAELIRRHYPSSVSAYPDIFLKDTGILEVLAPGVSKAAAVRELAADLGLERIVAFGDNLNDLPMLEVADVAVAVDNALPEVKAAADIVTGPNTASSVARFIEADC